MSASPTGTWAMRLVRLTMSPSLMRGVVAEEDGADVVLLEVEHHADDVAGERQQLAGHRLLEPVDARDAVADLDDAADLLQVDLRLVARELALDDLADLSGLDHAFVLFRALRARESLFACGRAVRRGCRPR